jgi:hypothetical protein
MKTFNRPSATGGTGYAHYDREWSEMGLHKRTERVAFAALRAIYGARAARAAIREAKKISGKTG